MIAYISGHIKITKEEFVSHYANKILDAIMHKHKFVLGDANGTDTMAQEFIVKMLGENDAVSRVTVFHMFDNPRNNAGNFRTRGGFTSDEERDATMTASSDYDIAWVRPGRENSGTAKNLLRRKQNAL